MSSTSKGAQIHPTSHAFQATKVVKRFQELLEEADQEGDAEVADGNDNENKVTGS
jgi:hypothetical protein